MSSDQNPHGGQEETDFVTLTQYLPLGRNRCLPQVIRDQVPFGVSGNPYGSSVTAAAAIKHQAKPSVTIAELVKRGQAETCERNIKSDFVPYHRTQPREVDFRVTKVGILVGSLRKESFSRKLAANVAVLFPEGYETELVEIGDLPLYNQDYDDENTVPATYGAFRSTMKEIDAVLFVTPEYNRSVPAVLKNALDVGSRPYGASVWSAKPAAIISQSPGSLSAFGANHHLRQSLVFLNMPVIQQPEAYIGNVAELFDDSGKIKNKETLKFLQSFVDAFVDLIRKHQA